MAPGGCTQLHFGLEGIIKSFNFEGVQYLNNQNYHSCIRSLSFGHLDWILKRVFASGLSAVLATFSFRLTPTTSCWNQSPPKEEEVNNHNPNVSSSSDKRKNWFLLLFKMSFSCHQMSWASDVLIYPSLLPFFISWYWLPNPTDLLVFVFVICFIANIKATNMKYLANSLCRFGSIRYFLISNI